MKKPPPKHFYLFVTGDPKGGRFVSFGHAVLNVEDGTAEGNFTLTANDKSWIVHAKLINYSYDEEAGMFESDLEVIEVKGDSPFPPVASFGPFPIDKLHESLATPNLFIYVTSEPPPMAPGANK